MESSTTNPSPRILSKGIQVQESSYKRFMNWAKNKLLYTNFRMNIAAELLKNPNKKDRIDYTFLQRTFLFFMLNGAFVTAYISRKDSINMIILKVIGSLSYTYVMFSIFGGQELFFRAGLKDDSVGYYIRTKHLNEMKGRLNNYDEIFERLNNKFHEKNAYIKKEDLISSINELKRRLNETI